MVDGCALAKPGTAAHRAQFEISLYGNFITVWQFDLLQTTQYHFFSGRDAAAALLRLKKLKNSKNSTREGTTKPSGTLRTREVSTINRVCNIEKLARVLH